MAMNRIDELQNQISKLPVGYISKKNINGKEYCYRQWKENGKIKSEYIPSKNVDYIVDLICERKRLQEELRIETLRMSTDSVSQRRLNEYMKKLCLKRRIGIGYQDYEDIIRGNLFYIDKTAFITDWWNHSDTISLITRPRRFGKTLTLSTLYCFFSERYANRSDLFDGFDVWKTKSMRALQGTYPVIMISFAGVKSSTSIGLIEQMKSLVSAIYRDNDDIFNKLDSADQELFRSYYMRCTEQMAIDGIQVLSELMYKASGKKVIILIDEYDTPMLETWMAGNWDSCSDFMRSFFNKSLKSNPYLEQALLTGITRISKESLFSDMNNFKVYSMTSSDYDYAFGFTEEEVFHALEAQGISDKQGVKDWYDGFSIGGRNDIYNPWSITNFLRDRKFLPYWINTSSNEMINDFFKRGNIELKYVLEDLLNGKHVFTPMKEDTPLQQISEDNSALWSLLFASGYMKIVGSSGNDWDKTYELAVTNKEVSYMLVDFVRHWFSQTSFGYKDFITALLSDDVYFMTEYLSRIIRHVFSYYDVSGSEPERFYHGFVLGMIVDLEDRFIITSNRESGLGRYDVMLEPRSPNEDHAIILEFKVHRSGIEANLKSSALEGIAQIDKKKYATVLISHGISENNIYKYGIAFKGKEVWIEGGN